MKLSEKKIGATYVFPKICPMFWFFREFLFVCLEQGLKFNKHLHKVHMTWKIFSAYLKGLCKYRRMAFFFLKYIFFVLEISTFFYYANLVSDDVILFATRNGKILNKRYLWKYWSNVLETWHHKCASQKKQNDTLNGVAIATLSAPVSFCLKNKYPHLQPLNETRVLLGKDTVPILS